MSNDVFLRSIVSSITKIPRSVSAWSGVLIATAIALGLLARAKSPFVAILNDSVAHVAERMRGEMDGFMIAITHIGDPASLVLLSLVAIAVLLMLHERRLAAVFAFSMAAIVFVVYAIKWSMVIGRPTSPTLVGLPSSPSYPSAHAACASTALVLLGLIACKLGRARGVGIYSSVLFVLPLAVLSILIGLSRIYVGVHWTTDVAGGFMLALAVLLPARCLVLTS